MTPSCRECHQEAEHKLSCSHVRYEGRVEVELADEAAPPVHAPRRPYCPGPTVACYYSDGDDAALCAKTGNDCYYGDPA